MDVGLILKGANMINSSYLKLQLSIIIEKIIFILRLVHTKSMRTKFILDFTHYKKSCIYLRLFTHAN